MNVLFVTSECRPFIADGSLAETIFGQVRSAIKKGLKASVIMPLYEIIKRNYQTKLLFKTTVYIEETEKYVGLHYLKLHDVDFTFQHITHSLQD